jgi:hypothetical protein
MRMVDWVHHHPTNGRPFPKPTIAAGFADVDVFVLSIAHLAYSGLSLNRHPA